LTAFVICFATAAEQVQLHSIGQTITFKKKKDEKGEPLALEEGFSKHIHITSQSCAHLVLHPAAQKDAELVHSSSSAAKVAMQKGKRMYRPVFWGRFQQGSSCTS
jgi:hypothetical protein